MLSRLSRDPLSGAIVGVVGSKNRSPLFVKSEILLKIFSDNKRASLNSDLLKSRMLSYADEKPGLFSGLKISIHPPGRGVKEEGSDLYLTLDKYFNNQHIPDFTGNTGSYKAA